MTADYPIFAFSPPPPLRFPLISTRFHRISFFNPLHYCPDPLVIVFRFSIPQSVIALLRLRCLTFLRSTFFRALRPSFTSFCFYRSSFKSFSHRPASSTQPWKPGGFLKNPAVNASPTNMKPGRAMLFPCDSSPFPLRLFFSLLQDSAARLTWFPDLKQTLCFFPEIR